MKYSIVFATLLAGSAIAAPATKLNAKQRLARRHKHAASVEDDYNVSWAGAVLTGAAYTGVSASFAIPKPAVGTTGETSASDFTASSWVGIDGYNCDNLWQAGVDSTIEKSTGAISYYAWYEWYPAGTQVIDLGTLTAEDVISVNLTTSGFNTGTVVMENKSTGKSYTKTVSSTNTLCGVSAEWIMEDLSIDTNTEGLANYGSVVFTDAIATTSSKTVNPSGANIMDIETTSNAILTKTTVTDNSVTIAYV
ncbi:hypothetical protein SS1G_02038 [Sclerotinia sclerotiorum 1980 UF-70]|uniref:Aspergillopepsin-2 n=2 Tax=Sclerotinia sclerotiorum (strain ATCC 18683 / 1980 / Ss-1) TaxID=665079 RepID=A7E9Q8_SCLS1|nr:hypothetical protein SS1G_02038 [Sclerotinia sclerotiorum 1980 UF-70]APA05637.1 hypothetical protein sscle_01g004070 [Sclerotinia sclerotiorum 1980 UF-70]EDN97110.1 hypothetical protein SS1G_02038 [Sclerotinia sclerotiorum 1980 UF-70]